MGAGIDLFQVGSDNIIPSPGGGMWHQDGSVSGGFCIGRISLNVYVNSPDDLEKIGTILIEQAENRRADRRKEQAAKAAELIQAGIVQAIDHDVRPSPQVAELLEETLAGVEF